MPVEFLIRDRAIILSMVGDYSTADLRSGLLDSLAALGSSNAIGMCFDVSHSDALVKRSPEDVTAMGYFMAHHADRFSRRVALVGSGDFPFGMMRLGSVVLEREGVENRVFRGQEDALAWIKGES